MAEADRSTFDSPVRAHFEYKRLVSLEKHLNNLSLYYSKPSLLIPAPAYALTKRSVAEKSATLFLLLQMLGKYKKDSNVRSDMFLLISARLMFQLYLFTK